jgi:hypothetical protein
MDLQIVVIGPARVGLHDGRHLDVESLRDDIQLSTVRLRPGEVLPLECHT